MAEHQPTIEGNPSTTTTDQHKQDHHVHKIVRLIMLYSRTRRLGLISCIVSLIYSCMNGDWARSVLFAGLFLAVTWIVGLSVYIFIKVKWGIDFDPKPQFAFNHPHRWFFLRFGQSTLVFFAFCALFSLFLTHRDDWTTAPKALPPVAIIIVARYALSYVLTFACLATAKSSESTF